MMRERHGRTCCPPGFHPEWGRRRSRDPQPAAITVGLTPSSSSRHLLPGSSHPQTPAQAG